MGTSDDSSRALQMHGAAPRVVGATSRVSSIAASIPATSNSGRLRAGAEGQRGRDPWMFGLEVWLRIASAKRVSYISIFFNRCVRDS